MVEKDPVIIDPHKYTATLNSQIIKPTAGNKNICYRQN